MKISELQKIKSITESLRDTLDSIDFTKGAGRVIILKNMINNSSADSKVDKEAVISVVDAELDNIIKSISLKHNKEDPLNRMFDESLNIKENLQEISCDIQSIEEKKKSVIDTQSEKINKTKNVIKDALLNMSGAETLSIKGLYFDEWDPESSPYTFVPKFTGGTLKYSITENNCMPDNFIERDGNYIVCFEEVGYALSKEHHSDLISTLTDSFKELKELKTELSNQLSSFAYYDKAVRVAHLFIDDLNQLFTNNKSLDVISQKGSDITMLILEALEMKEVWDVDKLMSRHNSIFSDLPPFMEKTLKDSLGEIIQSENHIDNYMNQSRQFKFRHASNINCDDIDKKMNEEVSLGVEIYKKGTKNDLTNYLKKVNPFVRMGIGLEIHKSKQSEKTNSNVISL